MNHPTLPGRVWQIAIYPPWDYPSIQGTQNPDPARRIHASLETGWQTE